MNITNNIFECNRNYNKAYGKFYFVLGDIAIRYWHQTKIIFTNNIIQLSSHKHNVHSFFNNHLDISNDFASLKDGIAVLLFWGFKTPNQRDQHQSLMWCNPRFQGRGDGSVYNRSFFFLGLKTIVAVVGGFLNSLIAKTGINHFIFHTFFGDQNNWSLAILNCLRFFYFNLRRGRRG